MTENNTTPDYQSTVEKARDFYANKTESVFTSEERLNAENAELELTITKLEAQVESLKSLLTQAQSESQIKLERAWNEEARALGIISKARDLIQEVLAGDTDAEATFEAFSAPFELLGVSLNREVEIEITMTWRGTIELPRGTDPEDLDIDDFASCDPDHNYYQTYFHNGLHDYQIRER